MEELLKRSFEAIKKRGKVSSNTTREEIYDKLEEELDEIWIANIYESEDKYCEEITDLMTVCITQLQLLGRDPIKEFEKVVIKNETRND